VGKQYSQESAEVRDKSDGFYGGSWGTTREMREHWRVVSRVRRRKDSTNDEGDGTVRRE